MRRMKETRIGGTVYHRIWQDDHLHHIAVFNSTILFYSRSMQAGWSKDMAIVNEATLLISALVSAGTSGVVALGVEWLAKPRLEARKDRILARQRAEFEISRQMLRIRESSIRLSDYPSLKGMSSDQQVWVRKTYEEFVERIRHAIAILDEAMTDIAPELPSGLYSLFTAYVAFVIATLESNETYKRKGYVLGAGTLAAERAYNLRWLSFRRRHRASLAEHVLRNPPSETGGT
jgi:hypothetical protein